jgi:hypothetical protein
LKTVPSGTGQDVGNQIPRFRRFRHVGTTGGLCWFHQITVVYTGGYRGACLAHLMEGGIFWHHGLVTFAVPPLNPLGVEQDPCRPQENVPTTEFVFLYGISNTGIEQLGAKPGDPAGSAHFNCRELLPSNYKLLSSFCCESILLMDLVAIPVRLCSTSLVYSSSRIHPTPIR